MTAIDIDIDVEVEVDLTTIEHLDFEHVVPCEHPQHEWFHGDDPAMFLIHASCPRCQDTHDFFLCLSGWERMARYPILCVFCRYVSSDRDEWFTIIRVIGRPS